MCTWCGFLADDLADDDSTNALCFNAGNLAAVKVLPPACTIIHPLRDPPIIHLLIHPMQGPLQMRWFLQRSNGLFVGICCDAMESVCSGHAEFKAGVLVEETQFNLASMGIHGGALCRPRSKKAAPGPSWL